MARLRLRILAAVLFAAVAHNMIMMANAGELRILSGGSFRAPLQDLARAYQTSFGNKLIVEYGTVGKVAEKVADNEPVDLAILTDPLFDELVRAGKITGSTRTRLAHVPIGLAVSKGGPKFDIGSVEAFRKTLLDARSIAHPSPAMGDAVGIHVAHLIEIHGLATELQPKTRLISPRPNQTGPQALAEMFRRGEVEIAIASITILRETDGTEIIGPLPAELQTPNLTFLAGIPSASPNPVQAKALIDFLAGPSARPVYDAKGMDP